VGAELVACLLLVAGIIAVSAGDIAVGTVTGFGGIAAAVGSLVHRNRRAA
jgi:hypothetical protein